MQNLYSDLVEFDPNLKGRLGGNIPRNLEGEIGEEYYFYAILPYPSGQKCVSVFLPRDAGRLINQNVYPNISVACVSHEFSEESGSEKWTSRGIGKASLSPYAPLEEDYFSSREQNAANFEASLEGDGEFDELDEPSHAVVVADRPALIQDEEYYYKKLEADGYKFLLQIDEDGYPENFVRGTYPLLYGALYLYAKFDEAGEISQVVAGFWQN